MRYLPRPPLPRKSLAAAGAGLLALCDPLSCRAADPPVVHLRFPALFEPNHGPLPVLGELRLSAPAAEAVTLTWRTLDGTAKADEDYTAASGEVTIPAGAESAPVRITLLPDDLAEGDETLRTEITILSGPASAEPAAEWKIRDTDRPGIVHAADMITAESAPPVNADVQLFPSGAPLTVTATGIAPEIAETGVPAVELGYAVPGLDWPATPATFTASSPGVFPLPLAGTDDTTVDGDRRALLRFGLPVGAASASFSERLVCTRTGENPPFLRFDSPTVDGDWAAAVRTTANGASVVIFGRDAGGAWRVADALPAKPGSRVIMRKGRLAIFDFSLGGAYIYHPPTGAETFWILESGGPVYTGIRSADDVLDFDGETLAVSLGDSRVYLTNRNGGRWDDRQTVDLPGNRPERVLLALDDGLLAYYIPFQTPRQGVRFLQRTGAGPAPWVAAPGTTQPPPNDTRINQVLLRGNVVAAQEGSADPLQTRLYRRTDEGSWAHEQTLPIIRSLGRGVIVGSSSIFAEVGPEDAPWRAMGAVPPSMTTYYPGESDFSGGVFIGKPAGENSTLRIMDAGMGFTILDEDSFTLRAEPAYQMVEPSNAVTNLRINVTGQNPAPVEIRIPFETIPGGTATEGADYLPVRGEVIIPAGGSGAAFGIPVVPDSEIESVETIRLRIGPSSYGKLPPASSELVVTVNDLPFSAGGPQAPVYVPEPAAGAATYTVPFTISRPTPVDLTVNYRIAAGTAGAGGAAGAADALLVTKGTLTLPAGFRSVAVPVTVYADNLEEEPETLTVSVTALGDFPVIPLSRATTEVIIDDRPSPVYAPDFFTAPQNTGLEPSAERNVLANDTHGHTVVTPSRPPARGAVTWGTDGTFRYIPAPNFIGVDRFAYTAGPPGLPGGQVWKWLHPLDGKDPALANPDFTAGWMKPGFDDAAWKTGFGLMGYGGLGESNSVPVDTNIGTPGALQRFTAYFRGAVTAPSTPPPGVSIAVRCDDAAVFYLNGVEIGRWSYPWVGTFATDRDTYRLMAPIGLDGVEETTVRQIWCPAARMLPGENTFAVSVHNSAYNSSDLGLQILQVAPGRIFPPVYVTVDVQDSGAPPVLVNDFAHPPSRNEPPMNSPLLDSRLMSGSVYANDGLLDGNNTPYDPILEVETGGAPAGPLTFDRVTGQYIIDAPPRHYGLTSFTYRVRDKDGWSNTATVTVDVDPARPYDIWRAGFFGKDSLNPAGLPFSDDDGDGVANLLEYVLQRNAARPDAAEAMRVSREGSSWVLEFDVAPVFGVDAALVLESSDSLAADGWSQLAKVDDYVPGVSEHSPGVSYTRELVLAGNPLQYYGRYRFTMPEDSAPRRYFRLRALQEKTVLDP